MVKNILLIRGLSREASHWGSFPEQLSNETGLKVFCIDLPGAGEFHQLNAPLSISGNTEFLRKRWSCLKSENEGQWFILGVSLGGMVCLDWALNHNTDALGFFVLNSSVKGVGSLFERMSPFAMRLISKAFFAKGEAHEELIYKLTSVKDPNSDEARELISTWASYKKKRPMTRINFFRQVAAAATYQLENKVLNNLTFLAGKDDRLCHYSNSIKLAKLLNCPVFLCHENAGHDFALDRPDFIIDHLKTAMCSLNKPPASKDNVSSVSSFV